MSSLARIIAAARDAQEKAHASAPKLPCPRCGAPVPQLGKTAYRSALVVADPANPSTRRATSMPFVSMSLCLACDDQKEHEEQFAFALGTMPPRFGWARFDAPELAARVTDKAAIAKAKKAVRDERVTLLGAPGAGKTSLAIAMLRSVFDEARDRNAPRRVTERARLARFVSALDLAKARAEHGLGRGEAEVVQDAVRASLLLLDDVGQERDGYQSAVAEVIHKRYDLSKPTWVTTWLEPEQAAARYGGGITRRLFEHATLIPVAMKRGAK